MTHPQTAALTALLERVEAGIDETDYWWKDPALGALIEPLYMKGQPAYHGSLDAAKALHDAVLPDAGAVIEYYGTVCHAKVEPECGDEVWVNNNSNLARAWLIAVLRALIAKT